MNTARTENGYSCACDLLPGWVVACSGDFEQFKKEVEDSIKFYVDCAKEDGDEYLTFNHFSNSTGAFFPSRPWKPLPASTKSSLLTTHQVSVSHDLSKPKRLHKVSIDWHAK